MMAPFCRVALLFAILKVVWCYQYYTIGGDGALRAARSSEGWPATNLQYGQIGAVPQYAAAPAASSASAATASNAQGLYRVSREAHQSHEHAEAAPHGHHQTRETARGTRQTQDYGSANFYSPDDAVHEESPSYYHEAPSHGGHTD